MSSKNVRKYLKLYRKFNRLPTSEKDTERGLQMGDDLDTVWDQLSLPEQDDVEEVINWEKLA
jgi:hypothetical protein